MMMYSRFAQKESEKEAPRKVTRRQIVVIALLLSVLMIAALVIDTLTVNPEINFLKVEEGVFHGVIRWHSEHFNIAVPLDDAGTNQITISRGETSLITVNQKGEILSTNPAGLVLLDPGYPIGYWGGSKGFLKDVHEFDWPVLWEEIQRQIALAK